MFDVALGGSGVGVEGLGVLLLRHLAEAPSRRTC